jgi:small RNA 2'-O-methyltransferase
VAFLQLKSTNPDFSYVIQKNPASGMLVKCMRLGRAFGWFSDPQTYNCFFRDAENEVSYKSFPDERFEYVNTSRYTAMMFVINAIGDFFNTAVKKPNEKDGQGFENEAFINLAYIKSTRYIGIFNQHFADFYIEAEEVSNHNYRLRIKTKRPLRDMLNYVCLFSVFNVLRNEGMFFEISDAVVEKYLACLQIIDAPYFVRYVFKTNLLRGTNLFGKYKGILCNDDIEMTFGNTGIQRLNAVESRLDHKSNIIDIGCGEGAFLFSIMKTLDEHSTYFAIDVRPEARDRVTFKTKQKGVNNVVVLESFDEFLIHDPKPANNYTALLVEVIEHMQLEEATELMKKVLGFAPNSILITTPNKEFNQFYNFAEDDLRHEDHKFEFIAAEFESWLTPLVPENFIVKFFDVGDRVKGKPTTLGAWIRKKEESKWEVKEVGFVTTVEFNNASVSTGSDGNN